MPAIWEILEQQQQQQPQPGAEKFLAVLIPHTGECTMEWAMMLRNIQFPPNTQIFMSRGLPVDTTREQLATAMVKDGWQWIFFLDSDVIVPPDTIRRLLAYGLPMVSGMYDAKKKEGFYPAAWVRAKVNDKEAFAAMSSWTGKLIKVDVVGAGCLLVHRSVFEKIREKTDLPFFFFAKDRNRALIKNMNLPDPLMEDISEDFWFCLLAKIYAGIDVVVDTELRCGHIATLKIEKEGVTIPSV